MNKKRRKKKRIDPFWKYYKLYTISLSSIMLLGLIMLWFFLLHYEKEHPYRVTIDFEPFGTESSEELASSSVSQGYTILAPSNFQVELDQGILGSVDVINSTPFEELAFIDLISEKFSEYHLLKDKIQIPVMNEFNVKDTTAVPTAISFDGNTSAPKFDKASNTYTFSLSSDDILREECSDFALSFAKDYATFCANDASSSTLQPYFPTGSEYLRLISSVDNKYNAHTNLNFTNETITEFAAYSESLAFVHVELDENMKLKSTGADFTYHISLPIYIAKLEGKWVVINIE